MNPGAVAQDLVRRKVDVIVVPGDRGALVFAGPEIAGNQLEPLKAMVPRIRRVGTLWNPCNPQHAPRLRQAEIVAEKLGMEVQALEARGPDDLGRAFALMTMAQVGAIQILGDAMFSVYGKQIADLALQSRTRCGVPSGRALAYGCP